jgi:hypothetical protein
VVEGVGGRFGLLCGLKSILWWRVVGLLALGEVGVRVVEAWAHLVCLFVLVLVLALAAATEIVSWDRRGRLIRMLSSRVVLGARLDVVKAATSPVALSRMGQGPLSTSP